MWYSGTVYICLLVTTDNCIKPNCFLDCHLICTFRAQHKLMSTCMVQLHFFFLKKIIKEKWQSNPKKQSQKSKRVTILVSGAIGRLRLTRHFSVLAKGENLPAHNKLQFLYDILTCVNFFVSGNFCLEVTKTNRHHAAATIVDMFLSVNLQANFFSDFELLADPT